MVPAPTQQGRHNFITGRAGGRGTGASTCAILSLEVARLLGASHVETGLRHRRRNLFSQNSGTPVETTGAPRSGVTPSIPYHLYMALITPQETGRSGTEVG